MENAAHIKAVIRTFKRNQGAILKSKCEDGGAYEAEEERFDTSNLAGIGNVWKWACDGFYEDDGSLQLRKKEPIFSNLLWRLFMPPLRRMIICDTEYLNDVCAYCDLWQSKKSGKSAYCTAKMWGRCWGDQPAIYL